MNKRHLTIISILLTSLLTFISCGKLIYEDLEECPQGVYISFYNQTPCMTDPQPVGEVEGLHIFAFDLNDKLVKVETVTGKVDLIETYKVELPPIEKGQYSFIAWAGTADRFFDFKSFVLGETTKTDVLMSLKLQSGVATYLGQHKVWQGSSKVVTLPDRATYGSFYDNIAINMLEATNRVNITLQLHESVRDVLEIKDFEVAVSSANGTVQIDRRIPLGQTAISYPANVVSESTHSKTLAFSLMELRSGLNSTLRVHNIKEEKDYFRQDLIGKLLLEIPNVNLECTHDFDITLEIEDLCKQCPDNNLVVWVTINNYKLHSFAVNLSNRY